MVSLHFLPTAPGEIGDLDGHAVVFDGEAGEFAQTGLSNPGLPHGMRGQR